MNWVASPSVRRAFRRLVVITLCCSVVAFGVPLRRAAAAGEWRRGNDTAAEAAAVTLVGGFASSGLFSAAHGDTVGYEFPEDEEKPRNVVKDVIVWTAIAGFVAFFVIKVFLEGDTDTPEPPSGGKDAPPF